MSKIINLFLILTFLIPVSYSDTIEKEFSVSDKLKIYQELRGEEFFLTVFDSNGIVLNRSNSFAVFDENSIFFCPIVGGVVGFPLFEYYSLKKMKRFILPLKVDVKDEVSCYLSNDGQYVLIRDEIFESYLYIFNTYNERIEKQEYTSEFEISYDNRTVIFDKNSRNFGGYSSIPK